MKLAAFLTFVFLACGAMAQEQLLNLGTNPNDGTGDTLRAGGLKLNDDIEQLWIRPNIISTGTNTFTITQGTATITVNAGTNLVIGTAAGHAANDFVLTTTTVNSHALSGNITISATDVGLPSVTGNSGKFLTTDGTSYLWGTPSGSGSTAWSSITGTPTTLGGYGITDAVPNSRTVNGHSLSANITVTASDLGLGNVENTALSTWAGTTNITTLGTITAGTWHGTAIANANLANSSITIAGTAVSLGNSITLDTITGVSANGFLKRTGANTYTNDTSTYLTTTGNGSGLTGLTQSQISGLTTSDAPTFSNVQVTAATLTYAATTTIDFSGNGYRTVTLTGDITFASSNLAAGRSQTIRIIGNSTAQNVSFPGGWVFVGAAAPTSLAGGKIAILTLTSFGTSDANVVAAYAAQP